MDKRRREGDGELKLDEVLSKLESRESEVEKRRRVVDERRKELQYRERDMKIRESEVEKITREGDEEWSKVERQVEKRSVIMEHKNNFQLGIHQHH